MNQSSQNLVAVEETRLIVYNPDQESLDQQIALLFEKKATLSSEAVAYASHRNNIFDLDDDFINKIMECHENYKKQQKRVLRKEQFMKTNPKLTQVYQMLCNGDVTFDDIKKLQKPLLLKKKNILEQMKIQRDINYVKSTQHVAEEVEKILENKLL